MKIRTDFVTNSSSSGFVCITVSMKNGSAFEIEREYDSGYGGYLWNGGDFEGAFDGSKTGRDVLNAIRNNVEGIEFLEYASEYEEFAKNLQRIESVSEIESIQMTEETRFDDGEEKRMDMEYKFPDNTVIKFADPNRIEPSYDNTFGFYGVFEGDTQEIIRIMNSKGYSFGTGISFRTTYKDKEKFRYLIIGEKTVEEIKAHRCQADFKKMQRQIKENQYVVIKESDVPLMQSFRIPYDKKAGTSIEGKRVLFFGKGRDLDSRGLNLRKKLFETGGIIKAGTATNIEHLAQYDLCVVDESVAMNDYGNVVMYKIKRDDARLQIISLRDFLLKIEQFPNIDRSIDMKDIVISGKTFAIDDLPRNIWERVRSIITDAGGEVITAYAKADYYIYDDSNISFKTMEADNARIKGKGLILLPLSAFAERFDIKE